MSRKLHIHSPAIHYFDMVRRCRSIREAARRLNIASSAVNRQILKLEDEIGMPLFERLPGGLRLTAAGEIFARHVLVVLQDAERVRSELDALQGLRSGHVEIATIEGVTIDLLPCVLERLNQRYPRITVGITSLGSQAIPESVISGQADIGLAFALPRTAELQQLGVGHFRLGAIVAADHPLATRSEVSLATCAEYPLILAKSALSIHHLMAPLLTRNRISRQASLQTSSVELAQQMARRGIGVAFQTRIGIEAEIARGELVHLPLTDNGGVFSDLGVYVRGARYLPVAVDAFVRALCEEIAEREQLERNLKAPAAENGQ
ncbi:LysR family transcriptional regulator [Stutzerimonas kirkiae]|uniref:LysR family transcriptional regulator n=1 Tax=Stutzerimonas kirkiae TaxID=2211392 RepID=UPI00103853F3|nr:LysR family transcriptional regulator [Stutzerimonas kirkiae]TBV11112.1 LysR family transcriptional regulator [Stutzerimonas kirkiae]TBV13020.1 LysR family transcriptional regulator [Stutzerimonas kirkiae]